MLRHLPLYVRQRQQQASWQPIPWLPEPELVMAGRLAPPILASEAAAVRIKIFVKRLSSIKPVLMFLFMVAPIFQPILTAHTNF